MELKKIEEEGNIYKDQYDNRYEWTAENGQTKEGIVTWNSDYAKYYGGDGEIVFRGTFDKDNRPIDGSGVYIDEHGNAYIGEFKNGRFANGTINWKRGYANCNRREDKPTFNGTFGENGYPLNGEGLWVDAHKNVYEGKFEAGAFEGKIHWNDWQLFKLEDVRTFKGKLDAERKPVDASGSLINYDGDAIFLYQRDIYLGKGKDFKLANKLWLEGDDLCIDSYFNDKLDESKIIFDYNKNAYYSDRKMFIGTRSGDKLDGKLSYENTYYSPIFEGTMDRNANPIDGRAEGYVDENDVSYRGELMGGILVSGTKRWADEEGNEYREEISENEHKFKIDYYKNSKTIHRSYFEGKINENGEVEGELRGELYPGGSPVFRGKFDKLGNPLEGKADNYVDRNNVKNYGSFKDGTIFDGAKFWRDDRGNEFMEEFKNGQVAKVDVEFRDKRIKVRGTYDKDGNIDGKACSIYSTNSRDFEEEDKILFSGKIGDNGEYITGKGKWEDKFGNKYDGELVNGQITGHCKIEYANKNSFDGYIDENGKGFGKFYVYARRNSKTYDNVSLDMNKNEIAIETENGNFITDDIYSLNDKGTIQSIKQRNYMTATHLPLYSKSVVVDGQIQNDIINYPCPINNEGHVENYVLQVDYEKCNNLSNREQLHSYGDLIDGGAIKIFDTDRERNPLNEINPETIEGIPELPSEEIQKRDWIMHNVFHRTANYVIGLKTANSVSGGYAPITNLIIFDNLQEDPNNINFQKAMDTLGHIKFQRHTKDEEYDSLYENPKKVLNKIGITLDENLEDANLTTMKNAIAAGNNFVTFPLGVKGHVVAAWLNLEQLDENISKYGKEDPKIFENSFVIYDSSRHIETQENLDKLKANGIRFEDGVFCVANGALEYAKYPNHRDQENGTCYMHAGVGTVSFAENPDILFEYSKNGESIDVLEALNLPKTAELNNIELAHLGKLHRYDGFIYDSAVNSETKEMLVNQANKFINEDIRMKKLDGRLADVKLDQSLALLISSAHSTGNPEKINEANRTLTEKLLPTKKMGME